MQFIRRWLQATIAQILLITGALLALVSCSTASPTSTPDPTPTTTPEPTPTLRPDGLRVTQVDFGEPVEGTVFEELLARFPDDDASRANIQLFNSAGIQSALGLEPLEPGAGIEAWLELIRGIDRVGEVDPLIQLSAVIPLWPSEFRGHLEGIDWHRDVAFDFGSVEQYAINRIPTFLGAENSVDRIYEVAFGKFDPAATEAALAVCDCDQPDLNEYGGFTYYSWDEEFTQDLDRRLAPPLYDGLGRGPRVMIGHAEAFWTMSDATMEQYIDVLNGSLPSIEADPDYIAAVRWMAAMGTIDNMVLASRNLGVESIKDDDELREEVMHAPLLKRFLAFASGTGYDGERIFDALVVVHADEATAEANASLLLNRIGTIEPHAATEVEIEVEGRFLLVRAYAPTAAAAHLVFPGHNTLLVHE
jgi:hypothetical protein